MSKAIRHDIALATFLNPVIADLCSRIQAFLDVAFFKNLPFRICRVGPNSGKTIGLQLNAYRCGIRLLSI
jgi:hypothetical protein